MKFVATIFIVMLLICIITGIICVKENIENILTFTDVAAPTLTMCCMLLRFGRIIMCLKALNQLVDVTEKLSDELKSFTEQESLKFYLNRGKKIYNAYLTSGIFTNLSVVGGSLMKNLSSSNRGFPINSLKIDSLKVLSVSPYFEVTWFATALFFTQVCIAFIGSMEFFLSLGMSLTGHLKILKSKIENMKFERREFLDIIKYHKVLVKSCYEFNRTHNIFLLLQLSFGVALSCVLGFLMITVRTISKLRIWEMKNLLSNFQTQNSQVRSKCVFYLITIYSELLICDYVGTAIAAEVSI